MTTTNMPNQKTTVDVEESVEVENRYCKCFKCVALLSLWDEVTKNEVYSCDNIHGTTKFSSLFILRNKEMANRPTPHQMEALVEFLEQNQGIARGLLRTQQAKVETKRKWQEFAVTTNAMAVIKNGQAWAKYWAEKKSALKKLCQQRAQSMRRTGGGLDMVPELSLLEQRLVAVMGGDSFATGTIGIAVDPFPQSNSSPSILIDLPSTSQAAAETLEKEIQNPHSPVEAGLQVEQSEQQGDTSFVLPSESRRAPRLGQQSRHNHRVSFVDSQVRRFEEIESRRVEAEMLNAQAQVQTAQALAQLAAAVSDTGGRLATALTDSGERLATAVRDMGEHFAAATTGRPHHSHK